MNIEATTMWKLVLAECKYHWVFISVVYALIVFLAISFLLFEGATWQVVSTTGSTLLILLTLFLALAGNREKRIKSTLPLPLSLRQIGLARLLTPICAVSVGMAIPWLFVLLFAPGNTTPVMVGRTLLLLGFLITVSATYALVNDIKHVFRGKRKRMKYITSIVLLKILLVVMFMSVYMLQYPHIHHAANLQYFEYQMNSFPGVLIFGVAFVLTGVAIFMADVLVFQRRLTFLS